LAAPDWRRRLNIRRISGHKKTGALRRFFYICE